MKSQLFGDVKYGSCASFRSRARRLSCILNVLSGQACLDLRRKLAEELILAMVRTGLHLDELGFLTPGFVVPIQDALNVCCLGPPDCWPTSAYELIGRGDLACLNLAIQHREESLVTIEARSWEAVQMMCARTHTYAAYVVDKGHISYLDEDGYLSVSIEDTVRCRQHYQHSNYVDLHAYVLWPLCAMLTIPSCVKHLDYYVHQSSFCLMQHVPLRYLIMTLSSASKHLSF